MLDPLVAGSSNIVPVPAAALTRRATLPLVEPNIVNCPPVPEFAPDEITPVAASDVEESNPVFELKVKLAFVFGAMAPVASVENIGNVVVSVASLATVIEPEVCWSN